MLSKSAIPNRRDRSWIVRVLLSSLDPELFPIEANSKAEAVSKLTQKLPELRCNGLTFRPDTRDVRRALRFLEPQGLLYGKSIYNPESQRKTYRLMGRKP